MRLTEQESYSRAARARMRAERAGLATTVVDATIVCIIAAVLFLLLERGCIPSAEGAEVTEPARASYRVWVNTGGGGRSGGSSTGISPYLIVTNVHVVGTRAHQPVEVLHPLTGRRWGGETVATNPAADVALVLVHSGDLDWVQLGEDPQPGQSCQLMGYGGDSVLKRGEGRFVGVSGHRAQGVPCLEALVESISGDSGGGLFDDYGRLVAVNWGGQVGTNKSVSTPASHVRALGQRWLATIPPEQIQLVSGSLCPGGVCPPGAGGYGGGGGGVMPPKQPIQLQPQQPQQPQPPQWVQPQYPQQPQWPAAPPNIPPPQLPLQPIQWPQCPPAPQPDLEKLVDKLAEAIGKGQPKCPEPPPPAKEGLDVDRLAEKIAEVLGDPKPDQSQEDDTPGQQVDLDELAKRVAAKLPPLYVDAWVDGKRVKSERIRLGETLNLHHRRK